MCAGVANATTCLLQHRFARRRSDTPKPVDLLLPPVQRLTDPDNWSRVQQSLHAAGVAVLLAAGHPVLLPPLASTSALAATAVQGLAASAAMQRAAHAVAAVAAAAAARKRALLSSAAVTLAGAGGAAAPALHSPLHTAEEARAAVAGGIAHSVHRMHSAATACAGHARSVAHGLLGPLAPFKFGLSSRLASLSAATPVDLAASGSDILPGFSGTDRPGILMAPARPRRVKPVTARCPSAGAAARRAVGQHVGQGHDRGTAMARCIGR